jgi:hypothetical protein
VKSWEAFSTGLMLATTLNSIAVLLQRGL